MDWLAVPISTPAPDAASSNQTTPFPVRGNVPAPHPAVVVQSDVPKAVDVDVQLGFNPALVFASNPPSTIIFAFAIHVGVGVGTLNHPRWQRLLFELKGLGFRTQQESRRTVTLPFRPGSNIRCSGITGTIWQHYFFLLALVSCLWSPCSWSTCSS